MTLDQLAAAQRFAQGPLDGYVIHNAQQAVWALLLEREVMAILSREGRGELLSRTVRPFAEAMAEAMA